MEDMKKVSTMNVVTEPAINVFWTYGAVAFSRAPSIALMPPNLPWMRFTASGGKILVRLIGRLRQDSFESNPMQNFLVPIEQLFGKRAFTVFSTLSTSWEIPLNVP